MNISEPVQHLSGNLFPKKLGLLNTVVYTSLDKLVKIKRIGIRFVIFNV